MIRTKWTYLAAGCAALAAAPAMAGERTGTGKTTPLAGKSICQFSGLNDDPEGNDTANGPPGRTQSYGQDVRMGLVDPTEWDRESEEFQPHPGWACNPNSPEF